MQNAIWIATIFGPFLIILGLWGLFYHENMVKVFSSMKVSPGAMYLSEIANLFLGIVILSVYFHWSWSLAIFVTLLGWVMIARGVIGLFFGQTWGNILANEPWQRVRGLVTLLWGIVLTWFAWGGPNFP
jgi:hypothetical protein